MKNKLDNTKGLLEYTLIIDVFIEFSLILSGITSLDNPNLSIFVFIILQSNLPSHLDKVLMVSKSLKFSVIIKSDFFVTSRFFTPVKVRSAYLVFLFAHIYYLLTSFML